MTQNVEDRPVLAEDQDLAMSFRHRCIGIGIGIGVIDGTVLGVQLVFGQLVTAPNLTAICPLPQPLEHKTRTLIQNFGFSKVILKIFMNPIFNLSILKTHFLISCTKKITEFEN